MTPALLTGPRSFCRHAFSAAELASAKEATTVSVCLSARDKAAAIGPIVETIRADLQPKVHLVDEVAVVNDSSADTTAAMAAPVGATVIPVPMPAGSQPGKGTAMATALAESCGSLVVFLDADVEGFTSDFDVRLCGSDRPRRVLDLGCHHNAGVVQHSDLGGRRAEGN